MIAAYRRTLSPSQVAWSERWQLIGAVLHSPDESSELLSEPCGHDDRQHYIVLSLRFNGHFHGEPGLAGVY